MKGQRAEVSSQRSEVRRWNWITLVILAILSLPVALFAADAASLPPDQLPSAIVTFMAKYGGILAGVMYLTRWIVRFTPGDQAGKWWNVINFIIGAIGAHSGDADRGLTPSAVQSPESKVQSPGQNFTAGTSPNVMPLLFLGVLGALAVGCAAPGSAHLSRQTVTGLHAEIPSTTGSGSLLKISFGRIQNTYIDIPTNSAPFSSTYQADASGKSPIFGNASTSTRDSVGYGESAVTTSTGGGLIIGSETGGVQRVVVPNLTK